MAFKPDSSDDLGAMSEINVTPLVDVMLVLLIIFMVTAPMLTQGLTVELPPAEGRNFETTQAEPSTVSVTLPTSLCVSIKRSRSGSYDDIPAANCPRF